MPAVPPDHSDQRPDATLVALARAGDADAVAALSRRHRGMVVGIARRYWRHVATSPVELDDFVQEGLIGLLKAVQKYNPDLGSTFSAYAQVWVRRDVRRLLRQTELLSYGERHFQGSAFVERAVRLDNHNPTSDDWAAAHDDTTPPEEDPHWSVGQPLPTDLHLAGQDIQRTVEAALASLTNPERVVLTRLYGLDGEDAETRGALSQRLGVSSETVRKLTNSALRKLRRPTILRDLRDLSQ